MNEVINKDYEPVEVFDYAQYQKDMEAKIVRNPRTNTPIDYITDEKLAELDIEFWEWAIPYLGDDIKVVLYADDFGMQDGPAFSYGMFEKYFKSWYSKIFSCIKKQRDDIKILFHTCGSSRFIFQDLIESGVDILNPVQCSAKDMDSAQLKKDFGKDVTFWGGGVDTQKILPRGTVKQVKDEVKKQIDEYSESLFGSERGDAS